MKLYKEQPLRKGLSPQIHSGTPLLSTLSLLAFLISVLSSFHLSRQNTPLFDPTPVTSDAHCIVLKSNPDGIPVFFSRIPFHW